MSEPTDRVQQTLVALRTDLDRAPLADVADVRRRGQQRARHQGLGLAAAAAAVVAVVLGGALGLTGSDEATGQLPASPSPSATSDVHRPDVVTFLEPSDVGPVGDYTGFRRVPDAALDQKPLACLPLPRDLTGSHVTYDSRTVSSLDAQYVESVLVYDAVSPARRAVQELTAAFRTCDKGDPAEVTVADTGPTSAPGTGEITEIVRASRLSTPLVASEPFYYELGLARAGNVVVVLQWTSQGNPFGDPGHAVWTDDVLEAAAARAIG
jgi:hypothetical protein